MKKRIAVLMLSMVLLLSACTGSGTPKTDPTTKVPSATDKTDETEGDGTETTGTETTGTEEPSDYMHTYPLVEETKTYTAVTGSELVKTGKWNEYFEEATNIKMDWIYWPDADFDTNYTLAVTDQTLPDLMYLRGRDKKDAYINGQEGLFVDYRDYLKFMPFLGQKMEEFPEAWSAIENIDGSIYGIPQFNMTLTAGPGTVFYRKDMLAKAGVEVPETLDEFIESLKSLQEYYGSDNEEFVAFQVYSNGHMTAHFEHFFFPSFGEALEPTFSVNAAGEVVYTPITDQMKQYLLFANEVFNSGGFDTDIFNEDGTAAKARILENNSVYSTWGTGFSADNFESGEYEVDIFAPFTSEFQSEQRYRNPDVVKYGFMHISTETEDVETLVKWIDSLYAPRDQAIAEGVWAITPWIGKEGVDWSYTDEAEGLYQITPPDDWTDSVTAYINVIGPGNAPGYGLFNGLNSANVGLAVKGIGTRDNLYAYGEQAYPESYLNFTDDESFELGDYYPDIMNHVNTEKSKFISGSRDIEAEWDKFVDEVERMGIQTVIDAHQAAYDRFIAD